MSHAIYWYTLLACTHTQPATLNNPTVKREVPGVLRAVSFERFQLRFDLFIIFI